MTKYVLNSGSVGRYPKKARAYWAEVLSGLGPAPKVLLTFFTQKREDWESGFSKLSKAIQEFAPQGVDLEFEMAFPETFVAQIKNSEVVYIPGGDDNLCRFYLSQFDLPAVWDGKVVGLNSASSNMISTHFWTCDWRRLFDGLGILPIKFIAHFDSDYGADDPRGPIDWGKATRELEAYGDESLPVHALPEGDYIVIE